MLADRDDAPRGLYSGDYIPILRH